jgi:mannose-6-phosphate isomerase-like protein (cupin superfamily)|tara:strand:+ start:3399 stop:3824 length:426 start_codon:yes stop_codon:yes gene_type:complete
MVFESKKHVKSSWITKAENDCSVKQPWGHEKSWSGFSGIHGKTLFIKSGMRTSFKYHQLKSEVLFLRSGEAEVTFGTEQTLVDSVGYPLEICIIHEGDTLMVQSGCPYRIKAVTDCEIIEIGNNMSDKPIRIEDDYGRVTS